MGDGLIAAGGDSLALIDPARRAAPLLHESGGGTIFNLDVGGGFVWVTGNADEAPFFTILDVGNPTSPTVAQVFSPSVWGRAMVRRGRDALLLGDEVPGWPASLVRLTW